MHLEIDLKYEDLNVTKIKNSFPFPISCRDVINKKINFLKDNF